VRRSNSGFGQQLIYTSGHFTGEIEAYAQEDAAAEKDYLLYLEERESLRERADARELAATGSGAQLERLATRYCKVPVCISRNLVHILEKRHLSSG
jgi:hypothetical protein